jgi:NAD(P)-dependent dehydrogenase (short-subunit alcohol dehydrogenase family)
VADQEFVDGRFDGKVALITGAGSGIGRAVALLLVREGARVFGVDINGSSLDAVAAEAGDRFTSHVADLTDPQACKDVVAACLAAEGGLDVLGNIAGIAASSHLEDVTVEQYRRMMAINADACFFLCQAAIPALLERSGSIVNLASNAGLMGQAYTVAYCMSKGAVIQLTKALAMEYVKTDLRVNAIAPAAVNTPLLHNFEIADGVDVELMKPYMGFRGMAEAQELARLFAFVASGEIPSMHGAVISVDNAITAG